MWIIQRLKLENRVVFFNNWYVDLAFRYFRELNVLKQNKYISNCLNLNLKHIIRLRLLPPE